MITPENKTEARQWLRDLRVAQGLSLKQAGERCGIKRETFSDIESGKRFGALKTLAKIARAFDFDVAQFGTVPPRVVAAPAKEPLPSEGQSEGLTTKKKSGARDPKRLEFEAEIKIRKRWMQNQQMNEEMERFHPMLKVTEDGNIIGDYWTALRAVNERLDGMAHLERGKQNEAVKHKTGKLSGNQKS
jgi:transcriptional regulator with XRE-family HTH domain